MLNKKKVLALVLAAATAFTFAPVSTLGLAPVVEAQAATSTAPATQTSYAVGSAKLSASDSKTSAAKDDTATITATTDVASLTTLDTAGADEAVNLDIVVYKGHTAVDPSAVGLTFGSLTQTAAGSTTYTFTVTAGSGADAGTYTIVAYKKGSNAPVEDGSVDITVAPISVSKLGSPSNLYTNKKTAATETGDFTIEHDEVAAKYSANTNLVKDFGIKIYKADDKEKTDVTSNFTLATTAASNDTKKTTLNLTANTAAIGEYVLDVNGKTQKFYVVSAQQQAI